MAGAVCPLKHYVWRANEELLKALRPQLAGNDAFFWATHGGAELDLLLFVRGRRIGIECKRADAPTLSSSMRVALEDLRLDELHVVYPGSRSYSLAGNVRVSPLAQFIGAA